MILVDDKAELASLNVKLQNKRVIKNVHGSDYVRIVEDTETKLTNNGYEIPGRYAEMWHVH